MFGRRPNVATLASASFAATQTSKTKKNERIHHQSTQSEGTWTCL